MKRSIALTLGFISVTALLCAVILAAFAASRLAPVTSQDRSGTTMVVAEDRADAEEPAPDARIPAATPEPAPTPGTTISPYPDAPPCAHHDSQTWHGLWNAEEGCHYTHTHNADPSAMDHIFGPYHAFTGQEISYAWQTHQENLTKHVGYKWATISNPECRTDLPGQGCIKNFRVEFHVVGTFGANFRFHSFWLEAELEGGGIIRTGGHNDYGKLCVPYLGEHVPLAKMDPSVNNCDVPPYRGHAPVETALAKSRSAYTWNSQSRFGYGQIVTSFDFQSRDDFAGIDSLNPERLHFICPAFDCAANHSTMLVYEVVLNVPQANFRGFTDVQGNIDESCLESGPNCVPLVIEDAVPGVYSFRVPLRPSTPHEEFDIYFEGQPSGWIQYPN
jgi:hypothetical protein